MFWWAEGGWAGVWAEGGGSHGFEPKLRVWSPTKLLFILLALIHFSNQCETP